MADSTIGQWDLAPRLDTGGARVPLIQLDLQMQESHLQFQSLPTESSNIQLYLLSVSLI